MEAGEMWDIVREVAKHYHYQLDDVFSDMEWDLREAFEKAGIPSGIPLYVEGEDEEPSETLPSNEMRLALAGIKSQIDNEFYMAVYFKPVLV